GRDRGAAARRRSRGALLARLPHRAVVGRGRPHPPRPAWRASELNGVHALTGRALPSRVRDGHLERHSRSHRQEAARQLRLEPGLTVLDVACGTGLNFSLLVSCVGPTGTIVGTDYSSGMLARATRKVAQHGWSNVRLVRADARTLTKEQLDLPQ